MTERSKNRTFTTAFKERAVKRLRKGESVLGLARKLGLSRKILHDWRKAYEADGVAGLNRKRGPKPGSRRAKPSYVPGAATGIGELAQALTRIAELERTIGRQQVDLDFFRKALHALKGPAAQGRGAPGLRRSSKP
jgi:transposase